MVPTVCRVFLCAEVGLESGTEQVLEVALEKGYEEQNNLKPWNYGELNSNWSDIES